MKELTRVFLSEDDGGSGGCGLADTSGELIGGGFARNSKNHKTITAIAKYYGPRAWCL